MLGLSLQAEASIHGAAVSGSAHRCRTLGAVLPLALPGDHQHGLLGGAGAAVSVGSFSAVPQAGWWELVQKIVMK